MWNCDGIEPVVPVQAPLVEPEPTSKKLGLLFGTSPVAPLAFNGLVVVVMAIDFGRALLRISPSMSISRDASPPEKKIALSVSELQQYLLITRCWPLTST